MSKTRTPQKIAREAVAKLDQLRSNLRPVSIVEGVHQFRVQYKKTRAFYRMANSVEQAEKHRFKKSWKRVYKANGRLRDSALLINLVIKHFGEGSLLQHLHRENEVYERDLQLELKTVKPFSLSGEKWARFDRAGVDNYFRQLLQPIVSSYQSPLTDRQFHTIRKNLKDFLYNLQWLDEMNIIYPAVLAELRITEIDNLLHLLGNYQNEVVQSAELRRLKLIPELHENIISIDNYLHHLAQQQVRQHNEIVQLLKHFLHLHAPGTLDQ